MNKIATLTLLTLYTLLMQVQILYDFNKSSDSNEWQILDDVVMGGKSNSNFTIDENGHGKFHGEVSTQNNGGFSSVRRIFKDVKTERTSKFLVTLKGDGKDFQFRLKDKTSSPKSYVTTFSTTGDWQKVEISLDDLYPTYRGQKLKMPNYNHESFQEIAFFIGNAKAENFILLIDKIELQ